MALAFRDGNEMGFTSTTDFSSGGAYQTTNSLTSTIGLIVKLDTANPGQIVAATAVTDKFIGTLRDGGTGVLGTATVRLRNTAGTSFVQLGGTVAINSPITTNSIGQGVAATAGNTSQILGYAMEAGTSGALIQILPAGNNGYLA